MSNDNLDSRALRYTDTYGQRFMREGIYHYTLVHAGCSGTIDSYPYAIEVTENKKSDKMRQHAIAVSHGDRGFSIEEARIKVAVGDLVTWACRQSTAPPLEVAGEKDFFGSSNLVNECGYAHAFCTAGEFRWSDIGGSRAAGVVRVRDPKCGSQKELATWRESLSKGALVMINGDKVEPEEVDIATGQTVYFAVIQSKGLSITDERVVDAKRKATHGGHPQQQ